MAKWKTVRVKQELIEEISKEVEKGGYPSLSEFVSEAIRLRMQTLAKERIPEYLERDKQSRIRQLQGQLLYTPKHIWAKLTALGNLELGVSDYFESQLKGIVYVGDFDEGDNVSRDEPFGVIETVAWWPTSVIHDLYSPIDGKIVGVNKDVLDDPYILNEEPYQWIVELKPHDPELKKELDKLLSFEEYEKLIAKLEARTHSPPSDSKTSEMIEEIKAR
jgi:glycine cleavage system H protein